MNKYSMIIVAGLSMVGLFAKAANYRDKVHKNLYRRKPVYSLNDNDKKHFYGREIKNRGPKNCCENSQEGLAICCLLPCLFAGFCVLGTADLYYDVKKIFIKHGVIQPTPLSREQKIE